MNFLSVVIKPEGDCCKLSLKTKEEVEEEIQKAIENPAAATAVSVEQFVVLSELDGMKEEQRMSLKAKASWLLWALWEMD